MTDLSDSIVDTAWLAANLNATDLRIFDCTMYLKADSPDDAYRVVSGRADYESGHVPGAAHLDLQMDLSDQQAPLRFTAPPASDLLAMFAAKGIGNDSAVVLYTRGSMQWATRVWWMLRSIGFDRAAVLNGGWQAWQASGQAVATGVQHYPKALLNIPARAGLFVGRTEVLAAVEQGAPVIVNALGRDNHLGQSARYGRAGRIPGSVNVPASELIDDNGLLRGEAELAQAFAAVGIDATQPVIAYCGGGIAATLDAFVLHRLGLAEVSVYDNSLNEWAPDDSLPLQTGPTA